MLYTLTIPIDAPTMSRAQAIAWRVLEKLPLRTAFAIKAIPPAEGRKGEEGKGEIQGEGETPPTRADGTPWTARELRDIEEGVVSAALRNDSEFVAAVRNASR